GPPRSADPPRWPGRASVPAAERGGAPSFSPGRSSSTPRAGYRIQQSTGGILKFEANLAEVLLEFVILEGSDDFLQQKTAVDNGLQTIDRYRLNHVLLICSAANGDPAYTNLIRKQCPGSPLLPQNQSRRRLGRYARPSCRLLSTASTCRVRRPQSHDRHRVRPSNSLPSGPSRARPCN